LFLVALLGWMSLFLFGIYHRLHPAVDLTPLASVQVWIWIVSKVTLTIGVAFRTRNGVDPREIGSQLNRTGVAVRSRAARLNIPLKKTKRKRYQNHRLSTV
jgi:hypothetical protein